MVIDITLSVSLQIIFILVCFAVTSYLYFKQGKKLNAEYVMLSMFSILAGKVIYVGSLWILKPLIIIDASVFNEIEYNLLMGAVLILGTIVSLKNQIYHKNK